MRMFSVNVTKSSGYCEFVVSATLRVENLKKVAVVKTAVLFRCGECVCGSFLCAELFSKFVISQEYISGGDVNFSEKHLVET